MARDLKPDIRRRDDCTIYVVKTKTLICAFVFTFAKSSFLTDAAHHIILKRMGKHTVTEIKSNTTDK